MNKEEIQGFARRVERLCDFLLDKLPRDGAQDTLVIEDLKADAANIQADKNLHEDTLLGLSDYMKGAP